MIERRTNIGNGVRPNPSITDDGYFRFDNTILQKTLGDSFSLEMLWKRGSAAALSVGYGPSFNAKWIYSNSYTSNNAGQPRMVLMYVNSIKALRFGMLSGSGGSTVGLNLILPLDATVEDVMYHLIASYDGSNLSTNGNVFMKGYLNGRYYEVSSTFPTSYATLPTWNSTFCTIGGALITSGGVADHIDDTFYSFRVYDRVLTQSEMASNDRTLLIPSTAVNNVELDFNFNQTRGNVDYDKKTGLQGNLYVGGPSPILNNTTDVDYGGLCWVDEKGNVAR